MAYNMKSLHSEQIAKEYSPDITRSAEHKVNQCHINKTISSTVSYDLHPRINFLRYFSKQAIHNRLQPKNCVAAPTAVLATHPTPQSNPHCRSSQAHQMVVNQPTIPHAQRRFNRRR